MAEFAVQDFFLQLITILVFARVFAELAAWLGVPSVLGELAAGVVLGPSLLGWLAPSEVVHLLAQVGVVMLLFEVGLDTDVQRLLEAGRKSLLVAVGGFIVPFVLGYGASRWLFGQDQLVALFVGGTLTATSIGITVRILSDLGRRNSEEAQVVLGAAVLDDLLGVVLLAMLYEFSLTGGVSLEQGGRVALFIVLFFVLAPLAARMVSVTIQFLDDRSEVPGLIPTTMVSLVLLFAWLAHFIGAPELLGGFAAGLALSRRFFLPFGVAVRAHPRFNRRIHLEMKPVVQLFTPIFFVTVGLTLDFRAVDWSSAFFWVFSLVVATLAIIGKFAGAMMIDAPWRQRIAIGMAMVPRGEVGIVFAELGRISGVFDAGIHAALVMVIAYTTLFSPFWIKLYYRWMGSHADLARPGDG